jgi:hypothetical protein
VGGQLFPVGQPWVAGIRETWCKQFYFKKE